MSATVARTTGIFEAYRLGKISGKKAKELLQNPALSVDQAILSASTNTPQVFDSAGDSPFVFAFSTYRGFVAPVDFGSWNPGLKDTGRVDKQKKRIKTLLPRPLVLPVTPEEVSINMGNQAITVNSINGRTYSHPGPIDPEVISFSGFFPQDIGADYITPGFDIASMGTPGELADKFRRAMSANQPFTFAILREYEEPDGSGHIFTPNEMTITSFSRTLKSGHGADIFFEMELTRWYPADIDTSPQYRKYKVKRGDSLFRIALQHLKNSKRWREIVILNPDKFDRLRPSAFGGVSPFVWASENLKPGTVLLLPRRS